MFLGFKENFRGTHTPPGCFIIEFLLLPIWFILFLIDVFGRRRTLIHKIGLTANVLIVVYTLVLTFI